MADEIIQNCEWCIYSVRCRISGKIYIGLTCQSVSRRWQGHLYDAKRARINSVLHKAIRRYGKDSFCVEIIARVSSLEDASLVERLMISVHKTAVPHGYNISEGGHCGSHMRGKPRPQDVRNKISKALTGRKVDPEVVLRVAAKNTGKKRSPERIAITRAIGLLNKGKKRTADDALHGRICRRIESLKRNPTKAGAVGCNINPGGRYGVRIKRDGKRLRIGTFATLEEAKKAYELAANEHLRTLQNPSPRK